MLYKLFGWWYRLQALKMTARAISGWDPAETGIAPRIFSLAVFFEAYLLYGSEGTQDDFGPKEPAELDLVSGEESSS